MDMGKIIRQLRLQKGLTQEELGKIIGVQKSAIRKYESGTVENMKRSSIKKLADFFNVSPSYLMGLEETQNDNLDVFNFDNNSNSENVIVSIGRGGKRTIYKISDEDAVIVDAFLNKFKKD